MSNLAIKSEFLKNVKRGAEGNFSKLNSSKTCGAKKCCFVSIFQHKMLIGKRRKR